MRKIFYNKFTKLFEMLCIIVAAAILLHEGIAMVNKYEEIEAQRQYVWDEYLDYEKIADEIYNEIAPYLEELILIYKEQGVKGLESEFNSGSEKWDRVFVTVADAEQVIYEYDNDSLSSEIYVMDEIEITNQIGYRIVESDFENYYTHTGCSIYLSDVIKVKEMYDWSEEWSEHDLDTFFKESTIQYLEEINYELNIFIGGSSNYFNEVEWKYCLSSQAEIERRNLDDDEIMEKYITDRIPVAASCGLAIIVATILLIISCGRKPDEKKRLNLYERGYTEMHLCIIGALGMSLLYGIYEYFDYYFYELINELEEAERNVIDICVQIASAAGITWLYYEVGIVIKKLINRRFFKDMLVVRILLKLKKLMADCIKKLKLYYNNSAYAAMPEIKRTYIWKIAVDAAIIILAFFALFVALIMSRSTQAIGLLYILAILFIMIYFWKSFREYRHLRGYNEITKAVDTIYDGNYTDIKVDESESNETIKKLANLSNSLEKSVKKQVESEKMQIDLVANVSHDLDKPLASIVGYIDLLKEEKMSDVAKDYVKVLIDKSARLQEIVSDVYDLAKATSGEQVEMEPLDGVVLINQVLSDMSDRIEETGKDLRSKLEPETAPIRGNGQKLYRVFQNVIDNALKYSMPGTRIYLNAENCNGEFIVTVKNVSEYEITFTAEEIMSRFTRGDKARHSEGNGLGLSIAKSFTELCGGSFEVKLDDDLFTVVIRLR